MACETLPTLGQCPRGGHDSAGQNRGLPKNPTTYAGARLADDLQTWCVCSMPALTEPVPGGKTEPDRGKERLWDSLLAALGFLFGGVMWLRSCAVCKALLRKFRLCDSVRCSCGWVW